LHPIAKGCLAQLEQQILPVGHQQAPDYFFGNRRDRAQTAQATAEYGRHQPGTRLSSITRKKQFFLAAEWGKLSLPVNHPGFIHIPTRQLATYPIHA
jgi:hypothetical protein